MIMRRIAHPLACVLIIGITALMSACNSGSPATDTQHSTVASSAPCLPDPASPSATMLPDVPSRAASLQDPNLKEIAMKLVASAEYSTLEWKDTYAKIEDIDDGRGYTGGTIGFTTGTHDLLNVVEKYKEYAPGNPLAAFLPALRRVDGTTAHAGLGAPFMKVWTNAATDACFIKAQDVVRDTQYFNPAVKQALDDGLGPLGQFIYYDAMVMHGPGSDPSSFGGIRKDAIAKAAPPSLGGNETAYLSTFLKMRKIVMHTEAAHDDTSRVDTEQLKFLRERNLQLKTPIVWNTYGDEWKIDK